MKIKGLFQQRLLIVAIALFALQFGFEFWHESVKPTSGRNGAWVEKVSGRVSHQKSLKKIWEEVDKNADFNPNDKVSTGDGSRADLHFGLSIIELERNTTAVLRRHFGQTILEVTDGTLIAAVKENAPVAFDLPGQPRLTISTEDFGRVSLNKNPEGRYQVQLLSGTAAVRHASVYVELSKNEIHALESEDRAAPTYVFQSPQSEGVIMGTEPTVSFSWKLTEEEKFKPAKTQFLEFSSDIGFSRPYFSRTLINQARLDMSMSAFPAGVSEIYYRLRDSDGRVSAVQKLLLAKTKNP